MNQYQKLNKSFIDGKWVDGTENTTIEMQNRYNDEVLAKVNIASVDQVNEAFNGAKKAQKDWSKNAEMRKSIMTKAIQYFEDNKNDILEMLTLESGSTAVKANLEFDLTTGLMEESLKMVDKVGKFEEKPSIIPDKIGTEGQGPCPGPLGCMSA